MGVSKSTINHVNEPWVGELNHGHIDGNSERAIKRLP